MSFKNEVKFILTEEDKMYLQEIKEKRNWSTAMIFKRALALFAASLRQPEVSPEQPSAQDDIDLLWSS